MALSEIAAHLGVSRQRAAILVERPDFPAPIDTLTVGRIWDIAEVRTYAERRNRQLSDDEPT
ncbi:hypothetical protein [Micromonospora sp. SH-82]|uniref:hypothetical protein n=1 Tax=Micromonospora sp. SH-82 TaxID=3132938 RepID=UPI003EBFC483